MTVEVTSEIYFDPLLEFDDALIYSRCDILPSF
jgi:hypothetical protein